MFDRDQFGHVHANANADNVVSLADARARRATGQPLVDRQPLVSHRAHGSGQPASAMHLSGAEQAATVGDWVRTATGTIGFVKNTYVDETGIARALVTNGSGINQIHAVQCLTRIGQPQSTLPSSAE